MSEPGGKPTPELVTPPDGSRGMLHKLINTLLAELHSALQDGYALTREETDDLRENFNNITHFFHHTKQTLGEMK